MILSFCTMQETVFATEIGQEALTEDGVLFSKDGSILVEYPCGRKDKKYDIPLGTEQIYKFAFWKTNCLEELIIPEGVVSIGEGAIEYCSNLKYLIIPSTLQKFGDKSEISGLWYIGLHYY
ncbi:MAG: leucine-rich repeat protein [Lachnospiraceae bacterium]|nr:leucine-rich repeat protein [Lachnospiraceae bacterium]